MRNDIKIKITTAGTTEDTELHSTSDHHASKFYKQNTCLHPYLNLESSVLLQIIVLTVVQQNGVAAVVDICNKLLNISHNVRNKSRNVRKRT